MIPIDQIFGRFRRQGRELSSRLKKDVDFVYDDSNAEVDGSYMDILSEPLTHILRNAMDHGMEDAADRIAQGKPARGRMEIASEFSPDAFKLVVRDDGRGIDPAVVRRKIVEKGLISEHEAARLSAPQLIEWIFHPGFSTRDEASEISGRGVGMNVIRERITQAGGTLRLHSVPRQGTTLEILLPMGLTTLDAILVEEDRQMFALPLSSVLGVVPAVERGKSTRWRELEIPVLELRECLAPPPPPVEEPGPAARRPKGPVTPPAPRPGLVLGRENAPAQCVCVDRLMGKRKLIYRTLGEPFRSLALYSGGAVLSSGASVLILDPRVLAGLAPVTPVTVEATP
jgi:two-component system chemotaxis sensor kinase CheA